MPLKRFERHNIVPIVNDGGITDPDWGAGKLIPVIVVDCTNVPALEKLVHVHVDTLPGDVESTWICPLIGQKRVYLRLVFSKPVSTEAVIEFDLGRRAVVVDWIMHARAMYLQPSRSGVRLTSRMGQPKIIIEVTATAFPEWEDMYLRALVRRYGKTGETNEFAKIAAINYRTATRKLWSSSTMRPETEVRESLG